VSGYGLMSRVNVDGYAGSLTKPAQHARGGDVHHAYAHDHGSYLRAYAHDHDVR